jgi:hypothetical protein
VVRISGSIERRVEYSFVNRRPCDSHNEAQEGMRSATLVQLFSLRNHDYGK